MTDLVRTELCHFQDRNHPTDPPLLRSLLPRSPRLAISGGLFCRLKRESRAEIDLQEVVLGSVNDIPGGFGEHPNMGSKPILEPSTKVTQHPGY